MIGLFEPAEIIEEKHIEQEQPSQPISVNQTAQQSEAVSETKII